MNDSPKAALRVMPSSNTVISDCRSVVRRAGISVILRTSRTLALSSKRGRSPTVFDGQSEAKGNKSESQ